MYILYLTLSHPEVRQSKMIKELVLASLGEKGLNTVDAKCRNTEN